MSVYTTKKEKLVVPTALIKEYADSKPKTHIFSSVDDYTGDEYYEYQLNTQTGLTEIFKDNPFKVLDRKKIGTINNKTKKVELNDNATTFENFLFKKNEIKKNIIKKNQQNLLDNGLSPKEVKEILPTNQAEGNGNNVENNSINLPVDRGEDKSRKKYGNYCYPVTLRRGNQDRLKITIKDRDLRNSVRLAGDRAPAKSLGSVVLPIPANLSDNNRVSFKSGTLNPLELAAAELGLTALLNPGATGEEAKELLNKVTAGRGEEKRREERG